MAKKQKKCIKGLRCPEVTVRLWPLVHKQLLENYERSDMPKSEWVGAALWNFFRLPTKELCQTIGDYYLSKIAKKI